MCWRMFSFSSLVVMEATLFAAVAVVGIGHHSDALFVCCLTMFGGGRYA